MGNKVIHWEAEPPKKQAELIDKILNEVGKEQKLKQLEDEMYGGLSWSEMHEF